MTADPSPRILLVDDDRTLLDVLSLALEEAGYRVAVAGDGRAGYQAFTAAPPDLLVLDLLMPELDGLQLCRLLREQGHLTPVIMLTSRGEEMDRVLGLEMGADDYVIKPFSTRELVARIGAALRRTARARLAARGEDPRGEREDASSSSRVVGPLRLDRSRRRAWVNTSGGDASELTLTSTEFDLLWTLVERPGHVASRDELIDRVYGEQVVVAHRTIDTFVKRLRQKLAAARPGYAPLQTVRGVGYRLAEPEGESP